MSTFLKEVIIIPLELIIGDKNYQLNASNDAIKRSLGANELLTVESLNNESTDTSETWRIQVVDEQYPNDPFVFNKLIVAEDSPSGHFYSGAPRVRVEAKIV